MGGEVWAMLHISSDTPGSVGCPWAQVHWKMGIRWLFLSLGVVVQTNNHMRKYAANHVAPYIHCLFWCLQNINVDLLNPLFGSILVDWVLHYVLFMRSVWYSIFLGTFLDSKREQETISITEERKMGQENSRKQTPCVISMLVSSKGMVWRPLFFPRTTPLKRTNIWGLILWIISFPFKSLNMVNPITPARVISVVDMKLNFRWEFINNCNPEL